MKITKQKCFENGKKGFARCLVLKIRWPKPKPKDTKLKLRPIKRLIGGPLLVTANFLLELLQRKVLFKQQYKINLLELKLSKIIALK